MLEVVFCVPACLDCLRIIKGFWNLITFLYFLQPCVTHAHCEDKTFGQQPDVRKGSSETTSLREKHQGQTEILQEVQGLDSRKVTFPKLLGTSEKWIVRWSKGECYHQSCVVPTVKYLTTLSAVVWHLTDKYCADWDGLKIFKRVAVCRLNFVGRIHTPSFFLLDNLF